MSDLATALSQTPSNDRLQRWAQTRLLSAWSTLRLGSVDVQFSNAEQHHIIGAEPGPTAHIRIYDAWKLLRSVILGGDLGFAQAYMAGTWSSHDLASLLYLMSTNLSALQQEAPRRLPVRLLSKLRHALRSNTLRGSRRNIAAHYDLGNDFYARWLDSTMSYSSAMFVRPGESLSAAQQRKYQMMLDRLQAQPGEHLLEIGCGWGGFAETAAHQQLQVTGVTLSQEQLSYARQRLQSAGLSAHVDLQLTDYRELEGQFDHIVSIEMFEAVGQRYWQQYFDTLHRCLKPGGRAALQVITIREDLFDDYQRDAGGFIQSYIFPGGMLPTESHLAEHAKQAGFELIDTGRYGEDYADTLAYWWQAFQQQTSWLETHGYDAQFRRMWHYYLAFCEAGFRDGRIDLVQITLQKEPTWNSDA